MAITLSYNAVTLALPDDLAWIDEFAWSAVEQTKTYTTTGALLIEEATRQAGRPITLQADDNRAWCTRQLVTSLYAWCAIANITMTLVLRGQARSVTFDRENSALEGFPVLFYADGSIDASDFYVPTIRLLEL
ncbi:MAG: hypothetical protein ACKVIH_04110 [Burkholderiales bacterium]